VRLQCKLQTSVKFTAQQSTPQSCAGISYPIAVLLYRGVFKVEYYASLNTLVLFIMLGIGADDVFVCAPITGPECFVCFESGSTWFILAATWQPALRGAWPLYYILHVVDCGLDAI
jgi:hypothetical protein